MKYQLEELSIELSNRCLLKCLHCSSGSNKTFLPDELTMDEIFRLIREARDLGATVLSLSGGDPILVKNVYDVVDYAIRYGFERVLFYTTGIHAQFKPISWQDMFAGHWSNIDVGCNGMYDGYLNVFKHIPGAMDKLTFIYSLESHLRTVNDYLMGTPGAYDAIVWGIGNTIRAGFKVEVHMVPMLPNWHHVANMYGMCSAMGVSKLSLLRFVPQTRGYANNRQLALNAAEFTELQYTIDNLITINNPRVELRAGCPIDFRHTVFPKYPEKMHPCHAGTDLILVRPHGDVHPCAAWKTLPETDNVRDKSLQEIWENGEVFLALRKYHEGGWRDIQGACASCKYQASCKSGCPAQRMHALKLSGMRPTSTIKDLYVDAPDPLCPVARHI